MPECRIDAGTQILLRLQYQQLWQQGVRLPFREVEFSNFSQSGEDGILWYLISLLGSVNDFSVELGAGDGGECNTANLLVTHGWHGLLYDGDSENVERGRVSLQTSSMSKYFPPRFRQAWITRESVNDLLAVEEPPEVDVFSLDLDGIDYWVWESLEVIRPRIVVVEVNHLLPADRPVAVPYRSDFVLRWVKLGDDMPPGGPSFVPYCGASLSAFVKLGRRKGYRLVGVNRVGHNAFFLRDDVGPEIFPEVPVSDVEAPLAPDPAKYRAVFDELRAEGLDWVEI